MSFRNKRSERGFTIIEIMVVIVILGILASYAALKLTGQTEDARRTKARVQIETFVTALEMYKIETGSYPSTEQGLDALVTAPTVGEIPRNYRKGGYIKKLPKDPWNNDYIYLSPGMHGDFDIISYGDDNEPGGEEKDADITSWDVE